MKLNHPFLDNSEIMAVSEVLNSGMLTQGEKTSMFEQNVLTLTGAKYAFATSSATTGLHLALEAAGIGPGDEVLIPDFSFPATANSVLHSGATPVAVDIKIEDFNIDVDLISDKITSKTKAIMPVHAFGLSADMDEINSIAKEKNLFVIEDAACALNSKYKGKHCGNLSDIGVFSFHPRKIITTGEGGMLVTNNADFASKLNFYRSHGSEKEELYLSFKTKGFNYRLSDILATIGIEQLKKIEYITSRRQYLANYYTKLLSGVDKITIPVISNDKFHTYQSYVIKIDKLIDRNQLIKKLKSINIETTLGTYSISSQPFFKNQKGFNGNFINSKDAYNRSLTLPLSVRMVESDVEKVVESLMKNLI
jgi:perosamine synthetase